MFYSVACPDWKPGQPLTPAGALLFRSRAEAESFAPEAAVVVVAVRYDAALQSVFALKHRNEMGCWSAPAVSNKLGGVTVFGSIPANLLRDLTPLPAGSGGIMSEGFHGWDSLTMALLA